MLDSLIDCVGCCALVNFLYNSLKSPVQLGYDKLLECTGNSTALCDKYGKWAAVTGSTDGIGKAYAKQLAGRGLNIVLIARSQTKLEQVAQEIAITGSTDGIGKAYAKHLARRGLNIVLISRSQTKLEQVAQEIEIEYGVETFIIQTDFAKGPEVYKHLFNELAKKPISIVVNNVGIGHNPPGMVSTFTHQHVCDMIHVNVMAATVLSQHFLDKWLSNDVKGCIVNISSCFEMCPVPYGAVYGASKAFLRSFTLALQHEVQHCGITVQLVSPSFVVTKINEYSDIVMRGNILMPEAEEYAKWAVNSMGKTSSTTGYFWHGVQATVFQMIPSRLRTQLVIQLAKFLVNDLSNFKKIK